tara:strand:- start:15361 stop:18855 length:3495 start_codon:yes stop_codon:yes gene_type:complete
MIPKFKDIISYHGLFLKAAKRRVRDEPHVVLSDEEVQQRALNLLKRTDDLRPRIHQSGKPISSNIEIAFLKEFKFFVSMMNLQAGRLTQVIRADVKDAFATLHEMQRELVTLDAEVEEKEIELLGNYSKVHLNTFSKPTDSQVSYTDKSWLADFKTGFAFQERYMMDVIPSAGAINPIKEYVKAPIVDAVVIDEGSDAGDSIEPFVTSNPRNVFRKNKVFKYAVVRQEFDSSSRKYRPKTSFDTYPWSCTSTLTMQVELANVMHVNTLKIHPLGDSTITIKEIRYLNEAGEEVALNALPIDNQTEIVVLFEPVFTKYIIIQFEQFAHVAKTEVNIGDKRASSINRILDSKGFVTKLPDNNRVVKGRTYDFSLREIQVGLSAYENKGFFRGQSTIVSSPVGMEVSKNNESIVPTVNFGTYSEDMVLPEGNVLQEAYVGVRLFDKNGNRRMDDIVPVLDTGLIQLEYLSPVSKICRYKLFPDLTWGHQQLCISNFDVVQICDEWVSLLVGLDHIKAAGSYDKVAAGSALAITKAKNSSETVNFQNQFGTTGDVSVDVVTSVSTDINRSNESSVDNATAVLDQEALESRAEWVARYNNEYSANTPQAAYKAAQSDLTIGVDITAGTISGRSIDLELLKSFNSVSSIVQTGKIDVQMKYTVSDATIEEFFGKRIYSTMTAANIAAIKRDPILYMGIGGTVFGGGNRTTAYAEARKLYSSEYGNDRRTNRNWVAINRINTSKKPTKVATEIFEFEITIMDMNPRVSRRIRMPKKAEGQLTLSNSINSIKRKILLAADADITKSSMDIIDLLSLFNEMRNLYIKANYGYKWNEKNRSAELVYDPNRRAWPTIKLARRNKNKTNTGDYKVNLIPALTTGKIINELGTATKEGESFPIDNYIKTGYETGHSKGKAPAAGAPKDPPPKDPEPVEEEHCAVWNTYIKIGTDEPHGLTAGDIITLDMPGREDLDGVAFVVSAVETDYIFYILFDGSETSKDLVMVKPTELCFWVGREDLLEVYKNNALLTIGEDYEISMDDGSTWHSDWPHPGELTSDFYRKAGAGRFYIRLIDYDRSKVYWTKYFVKRNQYLSPCKQVYLRNGRVVFDEKLKHTTGTLQPILINRMNSAHPYTTSVTTEFSLAVQNRDIVNNASAKITEDSLSTYFSGESLNVN